MACLNEAAVGTQLKVSANGNNDGSLKTCDEKYDDDETDALPSWTENEDQAMAEMCKAITKSDIEYVTMLVTVKS